MIGITTSEHTLATTRLATSPLWELLASLYLLGRDQVSWPYADWAGPARAALARPECEPLTYFAEAPTAFPDALLPPPLAAQGSLDDELGRVASADPAWLREEVRQLCGDDIPPGLQPYARDPGGASARLAEAYPRTGRVGWTSPGPWRTTCSAARCCAGRGRSRSPGWTGSSQA